jgi:hypothetical protein
MSVGAPAASPRLRVMAHFSPSQYVSHSRLDVSHTERFSHQVAANPFEKDAHFIAGGPARNEDHPLGQPWLECSELLIEMEAVHTGQAHVGDDQPIIMSSDLR